MAKTSRIKRSIKVMDLRLNPMYEPDRDRDFEVIQVKNSIEFKVGGLISDTWLRRLINSEWDVTVIPYKT